MTPRLLKTINCVQCTVYKLPKQSTDGRNAKTYLIQLVPDKWDVCQKLSFKRLLLNYETVGNCLVIRCKTDLTTTSQLILFVRCCTQAIKVMPMTGQIRGTVGGAENVFRNT